MGSAAFLFGNVLSGLTHSTVEIRNMRSFVADKETVSKLAIVTIGLLIIMKVVAGVITGSAGIRADAVHSLIDLAGAVLGLVGIRIAGKPADERHPFGHGKAENIAGVVIGGLIFLAAATITYEAIQRLIYGGTVEALSLGIYLTVVAIILNMLVSRYVLKVSHSTDSAALEATAQDLSADALSSCAVLSGLVLVRLTGLYVLDPIVALFVALLIARTAYRTMKDPLGDLMDARLSEDEEVAVTSCIGEHNHMVVGFHRLRTRKAGSQRHIDLHLVMPKNASVHEAHAACDHLEQDIGNRLVNAHATIHIEPCTVECEACSVSCTLRRRST
jgi:cation diffusion facilitator family transporter